MCLITNRDRVKETGRRADGGICCGDSVSPPDKPTVTRPQTGPGYLGRGHNLYARPDHAAPTEEEEGDNPKTVALGHDVIVTVVTCPPLYKGRQALLREGR